MHEWKTGETITAELLNALEHTADDADTLSKTNESDIGDIYNRVNAVISDVPQPKLMDGSVKTETITNGAVTADKLARGSVTNAKLEAGAVANSNILDGAVWTENLANFAVTTMKIQDSAVTGAKIANGTITADKLAPLAVGKILNRPPAISNGTVPSTLPDLTFSGIPCYGGIDTTSNGYGYETMYPRTGIMQLHNAGAEALNIKTNTAFVVSLVGNNAKVTGFKQDSTFPAIDILTGDVYTFEFSSAKSMSCTTDINIQAGQTLTLMIIEEADNLPPAQPAIVAKE